VKCFTHETILVLNIASITNQSFHEKSIHSLRLFLFICYSHLQTKFITDKIEIDGKLDESIWKSTAIASDFITFEPDNGKQFRK
jgi:low affinity Fe/Cu permease